MSAITTKETITDVNTGATIGLSDTINNHTFNELWEHAYVVSQFDELCNFLDRTQDTCLGLIDYLNGETGKLPVEISNTYNGPAFDYAGIRYKAGTMQYNNTDGIFCRVIWLYSTGTMNLPTTKGNSTAKVITSLDMSKISLKMNDYGESSGTTAPFNDTTPWTSVKPISWTMQYNGVNMSESTRIYPYLMFKIGDRGYINRLFYQVNLTDYLFGVNQSYKDPIVWSNVYTGAKVLNNQIYTSNMVRTYETTDIVYKALALNVLNSDTNTYRLPHTYNMFRSGWNDYFSYNTDINGIGAYVNFTNTGAGGITYGAFSHDKYKELCSRIGLNFETDKKYKVLITNGEVVGYTDDLTATSDIDSYTGTTKHDVPDEPSVKPIRDKIDDMTFNSTSAIYGSTHYYKLDATTLASFISDIEDITDDPNVMNNYVCCYNVPLINESICVAGTGSPIRIGGHTLSTNGKRVVGCNLVTLARLTVPRRHNNAFDNLTKYYIYTPFTGVIPLDYKCYGKTITVELAPSITDMTGTINIKCDGLIIYKQSVSLGSAISISVENSSEKMLAIVNACGKYGASAISTISGVATGNITAIAGGALGIVASTTNALNAISQSYNHNYGTTTGTSLTFNPSNIYIIEYVVNLDKPDNFSQIHGNLTNKTMTLTQGMGYTVCDNPKIYGTMSLAERTEIENYLQTGVIL